VELVARKYFLKFENFQVWVLIKLDSDAKYIFVRSKVAILLKYYFDLGMSYEYDSNFGPFLNRVGEEFVES
jgi:hypothetical protein